MFCHFVDKIVFLGHFFRLNNYKYWMSKQNSYSGTYSTKELVVRSDLINALFNEGSYEDEV